VYKIGEFSRLGQVSARMLRHYDQLGLLKPSQTDRFTGYRYYTVDQLARLHRIIALKELGLPLEQIGDLLQSKAGLSAERLRGMLLMRQAELEHELRDRERQLTDVEARLRQIEQEGRPLPYEIVTKAVPAQVVASVRAVAPTVGEMSYYCYSLYAQLYEGLRQHGLAWLQPEITLYHNEEYVESDLDVETAVPVAPDPMGLQRSLAGAPFTARELPGSDLAAALIYEGPYAEMTPAILALLGYVAAHRYLPAGPLRELHLSGPAHDEQGRPDPAPVVELQLPLQPLQR
jgi:DNA-binding transcriptional MerR regulator